MKRSLLLGEGTTEEPLNLTSLNGIRNRRAGVGLIGIELDGQHKITGFILLDANAAHSGLLEQLPRVFAFYFPGLLFGSHG